MPLYPPPAGLNSNDGVLQSLASLSHAGAAGLGADAGHQHPFLPWLDVSWKDFGADPANPDNAPEIQAALNAVPASGGIVTLPRLYPINATLVPKPGTIMLGPGHGGGQATLQGGVKAAAGFTAPLVDPGAGAVAGLSFIGLSFQGVAGSGSKGLHITNGPNLTVRDCFFDTFGDQAVHVEGGVGFYENLLIQNALLVKTGRLALIGSFDVNGDPVCIGVDVSGSIVPADGTGNICAILVRADGLLTNCIGAFAQIGIATLSSQINGKFTGCRAEFNNGPGFEVDGATSVFTACVAFQNSQAANDGAPGFNVTGSSNMFLGCWADSHGGVNKQFHGFVDTNSVGSRPNWYLGIYQSANVDGSLLSSQGTTLPMSLQVDDAGLTTMIGALKALGGVGFDTVDHHHSHNHGPHSHLIPFSAGTPVGMLGIDSLGNLVVSGAAGTFPTDNQASATDATIQSTKHTHAG